MELDKPSALPFTCHLNFTAAGGSHGDIIQVSNVLHILVTKKTTKIKTNLIKFNWFAVSPQTTQFESVCVLFILKWQIYRVAKWQKNKS